jgi:hypothetical protein
VKKFLIRAFVLAFLFFLSVEFYLILDCSAKTLFHLNHSHFIDVSAGIVSLVLLTTSIKSLCQKCKTFNDTDHKINKIR